MKAIKLFIGVMLAIATMAFVACEPDKPEPQETPKEYALEITSEATMEFPAEGGEGVIAWVLNEVTRTSLVPEALPTFSTEAEWIALDAENLGAFAVAANEGEAREAVINIEYKEQKFAVTVKQAAPAPAPVEATELAAAMRIPSEELGMENNIFALAFTDDAESLELGVVLVGEEGVEVLEAGLYTAANGGLVAEECALQIYTDEGLEEYFFEAGEVEVAVEGDVYDLSIALTTTDGEELRYTYSGVVLDMVPESKPAEPTAFTPAAVKAEYSMIGNFFLQLYIDEANYHELDMLDEIAPNDDYLSAGLYSFAAETISSWSTFSTGNDQTCSLTDAEITLVHNDDNTTTITGYIKSEEGDHITIDWTGAVEGFVYEKETGKTFTVEALSAKVEYDKEGQKDILFMVDELSGHKFSFRGEELIPGKPLVDGEYSSETATIDIAYCVHGYGDVYGDMTSAKATVANDLDAETTTFNVEWVYEGNTYQLSWSGAVAGINYADDVVAEPLEFAPVYVEMVRVTNSDRYFYFYDRYENELVVNLYNGKIIMPYINYEGVKIDIDTNDFTFEYSDNGLGKENGLYTYNVRLMTLDGRLIEFKGNILTYYN